jgi:hypothetical protein
VRGSLLLVAQIFSSPEWGQEVSLRGPSPASRDAPGGSKRRQARRRRAGYCRATRSIGCRAPRQRMASHHAVRHRSVDLHLRQTRSPGHVLRNVWRHMRQRLCLASVPTCRSTLLYLSGVLVISIVLRGSAKDLVSHGF